MRATHRARTEEYLFTFNITIAIIIQYLIPECLLMMMMNIDDDDDELMMMMIFI